MLASLGGKSEDARRGRDASADQRAQCLPQRRIEAPHVSPGIDPSLGGHDRPAGGQTTQRYAPESASIVLVAANASGGQRHRSIQVRPGAICASSDVMVRADRGPVAHGPPLPSGIDAVRTRAVDRADVDGSDCRAAASSSAGGDTCSGSAGGRNESSGGVDRLPDGRSGRCGTTRGTATLASPKERRVAIAPVGHTESFGTFCDVGVFVPVSEPGLPRASRAGVLPWITGSSQTPSSGEAGGLACHTSVDMTRRVHADLLRSGRALRRTPSTESSDATDLRRPMLARVGTVCRTGCRCRLQAVSEHDQPGLSPKIV